MTDIDTKALEHACLCAGHPVHHFDLIEDDLPLRASIVAHARAIEREAATEARHAAEMREQAERFSEAAKEVQRILRANQIVQAQTQMILAPFIIPAPDPLVDAISGCGWLNSESMAEHLRAAMQARGYEWRKIGEAGE